MDSKNNLMQFKKSLGVVFSVLTVILTSNFVGGANAQDICYFSNSKEHKDCLEKFPSSRKKIKYPILIGNTYKYYMWDEINKECGGPLTQFCRIYLQAEDPNNLLIKKGPSLGFNSFLPFKTTTTTTIPSFQIIGWNKLKGDVDRWELQYFNEYWDLKKFNFRRIAHREVPGELVSDFFKEITGKNIGIPFDRRDLNLYSVEILRELNKRIDIISSIIVERDKKNSCISLNEKFPELIKRYKNLNKLKTRLKNKIGSSSLYDVKPICN